ncbi:MAG: hypothetical protein Sw2LagTSB_15150 [Shewanella algae]
MLAALSSTSVLADGIRASLEMSQQSYKASDNVLVTVTLTKNPCSKSMPMALTVTIWAPISNARRPANRTISSSNPVRVCPIR